MIDLDIKWETKCSADSRMNPLDVGIVDGGALFQAYQDVFAFCKMTE